MNNSWKNNVNNTNGFVYFNASNSYSNESNHTLETSDFLSFGSDSSSNGSPQGNFSPSNCSSPRNHFNGRGSRTRVGKNYYTPIKQISKSKMWGRSMRPGSNTQNLTNCNEKIHSPTTQSRKKYQNTMSNQSFDRSVFFEPTCVKDPWVGLEQKVSEEEKLCNPPIRRTYLVNNECDRQQLNVEDSLENASSENSESEEES